MKHQKKTYKVTRIDESETVPYIFEFQADAIRLAIELNKNDGTTVNPKPQYYVKQN